MQEKHLFEYAIIRVVPRVEREEFINVGVIVYCPAQAFLETIFELSAERLRLFSTGLDIQELEDRLFAFKRICRGGAGGGTIGKLPIASRFRWLTAARSTVVQTSPVHTGMCADAKEMLARLHTQMVN